MSEDQHKVAHPTRPRSSRNGLWLIAGLLVTLTFLGWVSRPLGVAPNRVGWLSSYEQAVSFSKQTDKPLLIDFYSKQCPPCLRMDSDVFSREDVAAVINARYVPLRIDLTQPTAANIAMSYHYRVEAFPTLVIANAKGLMLGQRVGGLSASQTLHWLGAEGAHQVGLEQ